MKNLFNLKNPLKGLLPGRHDSEARLESSRLLDDYYHSLIDQARRIAQNPEIYRSAGAEQGPTQTDFVRERRKSLARSLAVETSLHEMRENLEYNAIAQEMASQYQERLSTLAVEAPFTIPVQPTSRPSLGGPAPASSARNLNTSPDQNPSAAVVEDNQVGKVDQETGEQTNE